MAEKKKGFDLAEKLKEVSRLDTGGEQRPQLEYIDIDLIDPDPRNRKIDKIREMAESIVLIGLQQPLAVRHNPEAEGRYIVVSGHRRRAGIKLLVDEGEEKYRMTPCMVAAPGESDAMIRLRLLSGNAVNQPLTSAQMAQTAEDMQQCIYELKEEGYEFPGKVRDYVAQALQVSGPKLARLKVIREKLIPDYKAEWEAGRLGESAAYAVARFPADFQERLYRVLACWPGHTGNSDKMEEVLKKQAEGWDWNPCLTCPDGKDCKRGDTFLRRDCGSSAYQGLCGGKTCCLECDLAKRDWSPCEQMCSKAKAARKEKSDAKKAEEEKAQQKIQKKNEKITQQNARRLMRAIEAAGLSDEGRIPWGYYDPPTVKKIREWANGVFDGNECKYSAKLEVKRLDDPVKTAKLLGCSADWLLGLTEELTPTVATPAAEPDPEEAASQPAETAPESEAEYPQDSPERPAGPPTDAGKWVLLEWIPASRKPEPGQLVAMRFDFEEAKGLLSVGFWRDRQWRFKAGTPMERDPVGWFPLPPIDDEVSTLGTGENNIGGDGDA